MHGIEKRVPGILRIVCLQPRVIRHEVSEGNTANPLSVGTPMSRCVREAKLSDAAALPSPRSIVATPTGATIVNSFLAIPRPIGSPIVRERADDPQTDRHNCGGSTPVPIGVPIGKAIADDRPADPQHGLPFFPPATL